VTVALWERANANNQLQKVRAWGQGEATTSKNVLPMQHLCHTTHHQWCGEAIILSKMDRRSMWENFKKTFLMHFYQHDDPCKGAVTMALQGRCQQSTTKVRAWGGGITMSNLHLHLWGQCNMDRRSMWEKFLNILDAHLLAWQPLQPLAAATAAPWVRRGEINNNKQPAFVFVGPTQCHCWHYPPINGVGKV